ncbi:MAG: TIR domain-containing protein [Candidatus Poribacteria bacterium]|nr:TIR domain-containing protein [Candidatus Poribacteria bacterium]
MIDNSLTRDDAWTQYVQNLTSNVKDESSNACIFPIIMEAGNTDICRGVQGIRWDKWTERDEEREYRLLVELTHGVIIMLKNHLSQLPHTDSTDAVENPGGIVDVFLSYSNHDGKSIAARIRKWMSNNTTLSSFFAPMNIPAGQSFSDIILNKIPHGAMLVIYTDSYSSRPWCRREVIEAKRKNIPMVVIDYLRTIDERSIPYLGNVPVIRMKQAKRTIPRIIVRLLDELLKNLLWRYVTRKLCDPSNQVTFMARPPELVALAAMPKTSTNETRMIVYPDPPLSSDDIELFYDVDPNLKLLNLKKWQAEFEI